MSTWATRWVWEQKGTKNPAEKLLLLALAECADFEASCYPGQNALAEMTHQTDRSVREHLKNLQARGLIQRTPRWRKDGTRTSDFYELAGGKRPAEKVSGSELDNRKVTTGVPEIFSGSPPEKFSGDPDPALILSENLSLTGFGTFWDLYPKKTEKRAAEKAWRKLKAPEILVALIIQRLRTFIAVDWKHTEKQFIPNAATWLNGARWEDEVIHPKSINGTSGASFDAAEHARKYPTASELEARRKA